MLESIPYVAFAFAGLAVMVCLIFVAALSRRSQLARQPRKEQWEAHKKLTEITCDELTNQLLHSRGLRQQFLDRYLGTAEAAKRDAWERVEQDPGYLRSLVADHLQQTTESEQLEMLLWLAPGANLREQLGYDPRTRLEQNRASLRLMTPPQWIAAGTGLLILVLLLLFPPWVRQSDDVTRILLTVRSREILAEERLGYHFLFANLPPDDIENIPTGALGVTRQKRSRTIIAKDKLFAPLVVVILGTSLSVAAVRAGRAATPG